MNDYFDPKRQPHQPTDMPSDAAHSRVDAAVARGLQPRALKIPDVLDRQTNQDEMPVPKRFAGFSRKEKPDPLSEPAEKAKKKGVSRRELLGGSLAAAGLGALGYAGHETLYGPSNTPMALLKMDPEQQQLGLVHRRADMSVLKFEDRAGADALTFTRDGLQSLLLSPELSLKLEQDEATIFRGRDDRNNTDGQHVRLHGSPRNIYMPYHLFAGAVSFSVTKRIVQEDSPYEGELRVAPSETIISLNGQDTKVVFDDGTPANPGERIVTGRDGAVHRLIPLGTRQLNEGERIENLQGRTVKIVKHPKLVIAITGPNAAKDLPLTTDIANAAERAGEAVSDTASGWLGQITGAWDDFKDWSGIGGDGQDTRAAEAARHDREILARERAKPHPQERADFYLEMDYPENGVLPNLHFYNGRTLEEPNYRILGEDIAAAITHDPAFGMRIIGNEGIDYNDANQHIGTHRNVRYFDDRLRDRAQAAAVHTDSAIEDGVITSMGRELEKFAITDNKLNSYEEAALSIASDQITRSEDGRWTLTNRFAHRVLGTPDQDIGR